MHGKIVVLLTALLGCTAVFAEDVSVNYVFSEEIRADLSKMPRGPLKVAAFGDSREGGNPNLIAGDWNADKALAAIVQDALVQGFTKGKAALVDSGENMTLEGSIASTALETAETNGQTMLRLTIRTQVRLQGSGGRTLWQTTLFGRGESAQADGITPALHEALDRTVRGLLQDDYFLIEIQ
ncbi:MAG: hypothetical protein RLZZ385_2802 [Pseudomonadota bacterium]|jgi:hypothetical protein